MANDKIIPRITATDTSDIDTSASFLPRVYRTDANKKFFHSTIHQLTQPGSVNKISGYIGRPYSKATVPDDVFVSAPTNTRQNYQLEPGLVINDSLHNTVFLKDYQDYINQLRVFGADVSNHSKLNKQEFYSWNPHIDWDKFVNFQQYYWMPHGPDTITIRNSASVEVNSTFTVTTEQNSNDNSYIFSPDGLTRNPVITLYRGYTYNFRITSENNPFSIKTLRIAGSLNRYMPGTLTTDVYEPVLDNNGEPVLDEDGNPTQRMVYAITDGTITFTVPSNAPDQLAYVSENNVDMGGIISILDLNDSNYINVDDEIVGKITYSFNNIPLSNGMRIQFAGDVFPKHYATGRYYVEGVGTAIQLINENDLQIITPYTTDESMLFDDVLFDTTPFSDATSYVSTPDYIVINRASADRNFWSRNNRWVHKDVIEVSATANNIPPVYDQTLNASRPIIEFEKNLKLFNFGTTSLMTVSAIDDFTLDAFSIVEGSLGYNIDGADIKNGQHVIFTADVDSRVTNNIYRVEFIDILRETSERIISSVGNVESVTATNSGWTARITGMTSTFGLNIGSVITATSNGGAIGGLTRSATVSAILSSTSIEYTLVGGSTPVAGIVTNIIDIISSKQIRLVEVEKPQYNQVVLVQYGRTNQGKMFWYNGVKWKECQYKTKQNQPPLFDVVNDNEESYGDSSVYPGTTFKGTSLFSYKLGTTTITDTQLGFPLSYKNIDNIGDIVFNFSLVTDTFNYELNDTIVSKTIDTGFLVKSTDTGSLMYFNGWETCKVSNTQAAIRLYRNSNKTNNFDIDIFDYLPKLSDIKVKVYVNNVRSFNWIFKDVNINTSQYLNYHQVIFNNDIKVTDTVLIKVYSLISINTNGYYEIPINLQNNPLNGVLSEFTLGEVRDHVSSIVDNIYGIKLMPGSNNLRDVGSVSQYGTKFVQHSGPASIAAYHITSETNNVVRAIDQIRDDYCTFKKTFMFIAESLGVDTDVVKHVNLILQHINKDSKPTSPYYFSDMVPYGASVQTDFKVAAPEDNLFLLSKVFSMSELSNRAVSVYLNDDQILHNKDYTFTTQGFVLVTKPLERNDIVSVIEYESTDGCLIPETPTKLGMWPKYEPTKFLDTSLVTPRYMIQGHDGSLILAYNDYRDDLILELEKRIYNNIKVSYDQNIFDINDSIPSYVRNNDYTRDQYNAVLMPNFFKWSAKTGIDFSTVLNYDNTNSFTYNYSNHAAPDNQVSPGYWRGIYQWMFDTDRPHICPWEMLGLTEEPQWWIDVYGPAPYTRNNLVLWDDISKGLLKEPNTISKKLTKYAKPFLMGYIPVDEDGNLLSPSDIGIVAGSITRSVQGDFKFGDVSPIETAWRRSSHYSFSVIKTAILLNPARVISILLDRSRIGINKTGQLVYTDTGKRITPASFRFPSVYLSSSRRQTAGLINYLINYIDCNDLTLYNNYKSELENITVKLCYRVSAFTSKEKFNLLLESKSPKSTGSIFIPQEDYKLVLSMSSPVSILTYSGVIITKIIGGFEIKGYSQLQPYFKYYSPFSTGSLVTVAGISESYANWDSSQDYFVGNIIKYDSKFYRVTVDHTSGLTFDQSKSYLLTGLPVVGGVTAQFNTKWNTQQVNSMQYGTKLESIQEVVDFLIGYGKWLTNQGFIFNEYNSELELVQNWETSAKEFMFWTTQNWSSPSTIWTEWTADMVIYYGEIVRYNGGYYKALKDMQSTIFNEADFYLLNGIDIVGNPVISLSPSANKLTFKALLSTVDDISNPNNVYEMLNASGDAIPSKFLNMFRVDNALSYSPRSDDGIYCASFYLVQREHVIVLNNETMFNDTIYNPASGYKQDKIKVSGYISSNWNGTLSAPGFIIDDAKLQEWKPWKRYIVGDVVKHKSFYYSANNLSVGEAIFNAANWIKLDKKPTAKMLPNWNYKATQFTDFYDLESDNFDIAQQRYAQHLIGYQKRQYLENIIQDDVSEYKFYQGMIIEKGTQNVLNKLFDVLSADGQDSLKFFEEWAVRTGQYGACSSFENIEFILDEAQFKINPQGFELVNVRDPYNTTLTIQQGVSDIYLKPLNYTPNLLPIASPKKTSTVYVRTNEVQHSVKHISELDITLLKDNEYIFCTFAPVEWNVYQYHVLHDTTITQATIYLTTFVIEIQSLYNLLLKDNDLFGFKNVGNFGFYEISGDPLVVFNNNIYTTTVTFNNSITFIDTMSNTEISILIPRRVSKSINNSNYQPVDLLPGSLLWTDNDSVTGTNVIPNDFYNDTSRWKVWEYNPAYTLTNRTNTRPNTLKYGRATAVTADGNTIAVSQLNRNVGEVIIYNTVDRTWNSTISRDWKVVQYINKPLRFQDDIVVVNTPSEIATVVALSSDGTWLALGSPRVDAGTRGVISVYERKLSKLYELVQTIVSPEPNDQEFGNIIKFGNNLMVVGTIDKSGTINGNVYRYSYELYTVTTITHVSKGSSGSTLVVSSTANIQPGMILTGKGLSVNHTVLSVVDSTTLILNIPVTEKSGGVITVSAYGWNLKGPFNKQLASPKFGAAIDVSLNNIVAISDSGTNKKVYIYHPADDYETPQTLQINATVVGQSLSLSKYANYMVISNVTSGIATVSVYELESNNITLLLGSLPSDSNAANGATVFFTNDYATIVIVRHDSTNTMVNGILVYNMYESPKWIFSEILTPLLAEKSTVAVTTDKIIAGASTIDKGLVYEYVKPINVLSWSVKSLVIDKPDITRIKQAFLYNKQTNKLIKYLDVVDPIQNKHPIVADNEIKYKCSYDPAIYSFIETNDDTFNENKTANLNTDLVLNDKDKITVDEGIAWGASQIGSLWWNLRTAKFVDNFTDNLVYRNSMLSTLAYGASVDIYEWVESDLLPSEWDDIADTDTGLALDISGVSLYGDNAYVEVKKYDTLGQRFLSTYYYWVKNKATVSSAVSRTISAANVAKLIANPKSEGYQYLALTGTNSFSLVNVKPLLLNTDVVLSIEYWTSEKIDQNIHTQWKLLSTSTSTRIPSNIEQKWIDSLCGKDTQGRLVPDQLLPPKLKYGVENRPRQSMFVNRFEAIKQLIEQTNIFLKIVPVTSQISFLNLKKYDLPPSLIRRLYDTTLDTELELEYIVTKYFKLPVLVAEIVSGVITHVEIIESGQGYYNAPLITITGSGSNAVLQSVINDRGELTSVKIVNGGIGYNNRDTLLTVRNFSALVLSDSTSNGNWSIYSYFIDSNKWYKTLTYAYDTTKYWHYADWYENGYSQFTTAKFLVNTYADLFYINASIGDVVKIQTTSLGKWVLLKKHSDKISDDWTQTYSEIGKQDGTIQFSKLLYDFNGTIIGFDGMLYDSNVYDNYAYVELRNILTAIKDDIFVIDKLKDQYLQLFLASVRYAMSEQTYIDWIFKTSFVSVVHQVGDLHQSYTYKNDNLSNFEDYVSEVKPYRTQVREYKSAYTMLETSGTSVTDFDLPATFDPDRNTISVVDYDSHLLQSYPWKHWLDNVGYSIIDIKLVNHGSEYLTEPTVVIESSTGSGAIARAYIANKQVSRVKILTIGSGYTTTPVIKLEGGRSNSGIPATAIAILGNSVVRSNQIKLKFDRIYQDYLIDDLQYTEILTNVTGKQLQFPLKWVPDVTIGKTEVVVNSVLEIRDNYKVGSTVSIINGYPVTTGNIIFKVPPPKNSIIEVLYYKDTSILTATDRIHYFYKPSAGDIGNDLPQLMSGIDYGGVVVSGLQFDVVHGWDSMPYFVDTWDNFDPDQNDVSYTLGRQFNYTIKMPYVPEVGTKFNVYFKQAGTTDPVRIDADPYTYNPLKPNIIMESPVANGDSDIIEIPTELDTSEGDTIIVRKETSDGSITASNDYDSMLSGGNFLYGSAAGVLAEDIIVDGDEFNSVVSGIGPEEVVPGQVVDTLAIKVFNDVSEGAYMQFKDVLNKVRYVRLNAQKTTTLVNDLNDYDTSITVQDASSFDEPVKSRNKPGIIEINGERIEFFTKNGNVLSDLRRGTLGTGAPSIHLSGLKVQEINTSETIPYSDNIQVEQVIITSNSQRFINASFIPTKTSVVWQFKSGFVSSVPAEYGQTDEIEVFVGGYKNLAIWMPIIEYKIDDIVNVGVYVYRCNTAHISSSEFKTDRAVWSYFIGNTRLKKAPYLVYNINSTDGEIQFDADFSVNGKNNRIRLTNLLTTDTIVTIVRRQGKPWLANQKELNFINYVPGATY